LFGKYLGEELKEFRKKKFICNNISTGRISFFEKFEFSLKKFGNPGKKFFKKNWGEGSLIYMMENGK